MPNFKDYIFGLLPHYFKASDSYKDSYGKGLLERFLESLGQEWDDNLLVKLEDTINLYDVDLVNDDFLTLIAEKLGSPPDITENDRYQDILRYIVSIYKIKGTKEALIVYFDIAGYYINIIEQNLDDSIYGFFNYDSGVPYDKNCQLCTPIDITFISKEHDATNPSLTYIDQDTLDRLNKALAFNLPVNVKVDNLINSVPYEEAAAKSFAEDIVVKRLQAQQYDMFDYDDGFTYDQSLITQQEDIRVDTDEQLQTNTTLVTAINFIEYLALVEPINVSTYSIRRD